MRHREAALQTERLARIGIDVVVREVAARHVEADAVPRREVIAGGLGLDGDLVHAPRLHQLRALAGAGIGVLFTLPFAFIMQAAGYLLIAGTVKPRRTPSGGGRPRRDDDDDDDEE